VLVCSCREECEGGVRKDLNLVNDGIKLKVFIDFILESILKIFYVSC